MKLAREHTAEAIDALVAALKSPRERVAAATVLLNRGWGQPKLPVEAEGAINNWVIRIPAEEATEEAWLERYCPPEIKRARLIAEAAGKVVDLTPSVKVHDVPPDDAAK